MVCIATWQAMQNPYRQGGKCGDLGSMLTMAFDWWLVLHCPAPYQATSECLCLVIRFVVCCWCNCSQPHVTHADIHSESHISTSLCCSALSSDRLAGMVLSLNDRSTCLAPKPTLALCSHLLPPPPLLCKHGQCVYSVLCWLQEQRSIAGVAGESSRAALERVSALEQSLRDSHRAAQVQSTSLQAQVQVRLWPCF